MGNLGAIAERVAPAPLREAVALRAVCVRVGGEMVSEVSDAARGVMRLISSALPQLEWIVVHMVRGEGEGVGEGES